MRTTPSSLARFAWIERRSKACARLRRDAAMQPTSSRWSSAPLPRLPPSLSWSTVALSLKTFARRTGHV
eukprot:884838-Pyramimonas_sp.AAC.1